MQRSQRLVFLGIALVIVAIAVIVRLAAGSGDGTSTVSSAGTVPTLTQGSVKKLTYTHGDQVRFRVRVDQPDEVHVHGYNIERELKANQPTTISFRATIDGVFEVELHHADVQIAQLTGEPQ